MSERDIFDEEEAPARQWQRARFVDAIITQMKTRGGRTLVYGILEQCGIMRNAFTGQRETTDFNLGQQNVGHWLFDLLDANCPEQYLTMLKEAKEDYFNDGTRPAAGTATAAN